MSESSKEVEHLEVAALATEELEEILSTGEANTELVEKFSNVERSVFMAGQQGVMGVSEGLATLAGFAGRGHQACLASKYGEGETFFMSKSETYKNMMEALAAKPQSIPKPTDTDKRQMSGAKDRI